MDLLNRVLELTSDRHELNSTLIELSNMIGLNDVKQKICEMILHFLFFDVATDVTNKRMYNVVITGPPGVGKSQLIDILARIHFALISEPMPEKLHYVGSPKPEDTIIIHVDWWLEFIKQQTLDTVEQLRVMQVDTPEDERRISNVDLYQRLSWIYDVCNELSEHTVPISRKFRLSTDSTRKEPINKKKIVYLHRYSLVGKYQGHTAKDTIELLNQGKDSVIVMDEAYELCNSGTEDDGDSFGREALGVINGFMTENPRTRFIIAGYKHQIENTIFKIQPGLRSRFLWNFDIQGYTSSEMAQMFLKKISLNVDSKITLEWCSKKIETKKHLFHAYGRSVDDFISILETVVSTRCVLSGIKKVDACVTTTDFKLALSRMDQDKEHISNTMYS